MTLINVQNSFAEFNKGSYIYEYIEEYVMEKL